MTRCSALTWNATSFMASGTTSSNQTQRQLDTFIYLQRLSDPQRRALVRALRQELTRTRDRQRLLVFARRWLYDHQLIIVHERSLRSTIVSATRQYEAALARAC